MADNQSAGPQTNPAGGERGGRRRGGGRGGASHNSNRTDHRRNEGGRTEGGVGETRNYRGRGGGRRGRGGHGNERNIPPRTATSGGGGQPPGEDPDGPGTSGDHPTGDAIKVEGEATATTTGKQLITAATDEPDDGEVCFICASTVEHTSVAPCNHRTCHICALRLRALYKNKACAHCRVCQIPGPPSFGPDLTRTSRLSHRL